MANQPLADVHVHMRASGERRQRAAVGVDQLEAADVECFLALARDAHDVRWRIRRRKSAVCGRHDL